MELEQLIRHTLADLPTTCHDDCWHWFILAYGDPDYEFLRTNQHCKRGVQGLPYYVCRYCHAKQDKLGPPLSNQ